MDSAESYEPPFKREGLIDWVEKSLAICKKFKGLRCGREVLLTKVARDSEGYLGIYRTRLFLDSIDRILNYVLAMERRKALANLSVLLMELKIDEGKHRGVPLAIDRVFMDFDDEDKSRAERDAQRVVEALESAGVIPAVFETRKGFHIYVFLKKLERVGESAATSYSLVFDRIKTITGELPETLDKQVRDPMRLARLPFTIHEKWGKMIEPPSWYEYKGVDYYRAHGLPSEISFSSSDVRVTRKRWFKRKRRVAISLPTSVGGYNVREPGWPGWKCEQRNEMGLPPCTASVVDSLAAGMNPTHFERFTLVTDMAYLGYSIEEILTVFRSAADFDEKIARYQIQHIVKKGYKPPSCKRRVMEGMNCPFLRISNS